MVSLPERGKGGKNFRTGKKKRNCGETGLTRKQREAELVGQRVGNEKEKYRRN